MYVAVLPETRAETMALYEDLLLNQENKDSRLKAHFDLLYKKIRRSDDGNDSKRQVLKTTPHQSEDGHTLFGIYIDGDLFVKSVSPKE